MVPLPCAPKQGFSVNYCKIRFLVLCQWIRLPLSLERAGLWCPVATCPRVPPVFHWLRILDASNDKRLPGLPYPGNTGPSARYLSPCRSASSYQIWVGELLAFVLNFFPLAASQNVGLQGLIKWLSWEHHVAIRIFHLVWHLFPFPAAILFSMALRACFLKTHLTVHPKTTV